MMPYDKYVKVLLLKYDASRSVLALNNEEWEIYMIYCFENCYMNITNSFKSWFSLDAAAS